MNLTLQQTSARLVGRNPFAVQPGRLSFHFNNGETISNLVRQLELHEWRGEIVGPPGSGKTTLVHTMLPALQESGRDPRILHVRAGESRLPIVGSDLQTWNKTTQIIVDGYEQLGNWTRTLLTRICRNQRCGLLRVSQQPSEEPLLYRTATSLEVAHVLVRDLQANEETRVSEEEVAISYERHGGNLREVFRELHDSYERRRNERGSGDPRPGEL
jgi:hypothetical protein